MKYRYPKLYLKYMNLNIKSIMVYDWDFILGIIAMILKCATNFCMLLFLFELTDTIAGWSFDRMLFLYGMSTVSFALWHCFFINTITIPTYIQSGEFDRFMLKPIDPLFQIILEGFDEDGWGELLFGMVVLAISVIKMETIRWSIILIPIFGVCGCLIVASLSILFSAVAFWTTGNIDLTDNVMDFKEFARYPIIIYSKAIAFVLSFVIPIGFTAYYPGVLFFETDEKVSIMPFLTIPISIVFFLISWFIWHKSMSKYSSSGH